ncbi:lipase family protein [Nocardia yamanashiensis]|uniref:lipase family protein n=1 Tax=Nocardia yamanashiensis TaxID=209247 RepID=UPI001E62FFCD|nr:lipase family protein [Nocardia yamanashiensis]UGT38917.1 lipase family protein [Nocardia yamanashiensis]
MAAAVAAGVLFTLPATVAQADPAGSLISATAQPSSFHDIPNGSVVTYWTTRSNGEPVRASGALFLPEGQAPAGGWPIMAYDHGTTGLGAGCGGQSDPATAPWPTERANEDEIMRYFVSRGFAVVAPDYLGLGLFETGPHPYLELRSEATATIDLVRAARAAEPALSRTWAVTGASQGGQAALGTSNLQVSAAPELDFRGTIAIDPASDVEKFLPVAGPWVPALPGESGSGIDGFIAGILAGLRAARPDAQVDSYLTDTGRQLLDSIGDVCQPEITRRMQAASIGALLSRPLSQGPLPAVLNDYMAVPVRGYDQPILLLANATDTTVPSPLHALLATQFAANGVDFSTVVGTGKHCQLNPAMWAAIDAFTTRVLATPTVS